jgi:SPW repeat
MQIVRVPSGLTILAGLILAASPWLLHFRRDHVAFLDVAVGGIVVALLELLTITRRKWRGRGPIRPADRDLRP